MRVLALSPLLAALGVTVALAAPGQLSEIHVDVLEDAQPLRDVLQRLEVAHGLNYVVNEAVLDQAGTVTVRLRDVPLDVALEAICSACGLSLEIRGTVLVILPKHARQGPLLPEVKEGLTRSPEALDRTPPNRPRPRPARDPEAPVLSRVVGTLEEVDQEDGRLTLQIDGVRRNFYLPEDDPTDPDRRAERLAIAFKTLKPGTRIALQYQRHPTRPLITDMVGGAYAGTQRGRPERPDEREAEAAETPAPRKPKTVLEPEGIVFGTFRGLKGGKVTIELADGSRVACRVPGEDQADRRAKILERLEGLADGKRIGVTYEDRDGARVIQDTIIQAN